jgi:hypothetical protein
VPGNAISARDEAGADAPPEVGVGKAVALADGEAEAEAAVEVSMPPQPAGKRAAIKTTTPIN